MAEDRIRTEINRLYWGSDASVSDIADRLGVSRRALYDQIDHRPAGVLCADCGGPLGYRNRTAAENREAECAECGLEQDLSADEVATTDAGEPQMEQESAAGPMAPLRPRRVPEAASGAVLSGTLLAGLALGSVVGWMIRRR